MKSVWIVAASAASAAAAIALGACGPQKVEVRNDHASAEAGPEGVSVTTTDHGRTVNVVQNGGSAGGGMPVFAPQYPGGAVTSTYAAAQNGEHGGVYAFTTADAADKVFEFYRAKAEAGGLTSQTNIETGGARVYAADGAGGSLAVTAAPQGAGKTYVQVTWSAKG